MSQAIEQAAQPEATRAPAVWLERGFRPFFLFGSIHGALLIPFWTAAWTGRVSPPRWWTPTGWHAHEVMSGVVCAAVAGFLLTAVPVWTNTRPTRGWPLGGLVALWAGGRLAFALADFVPAWAIAAIDLAFLPTLAATLARPLFRADQRRNQGFFWLLVAWAGANAAAHAAALGIFPGAPRELVHLPVHVVVVILVVVAGRLIPLFTRRACQRRGEISPVRDYDQLKILSVVVLVAALAVDALGVATGEETEEHGAALRLLAGSLLALRWWGWGGRRTLSDPLVWSLHLAFAFVPLGLFLEAMSEIHPSISEVAGLHAIGVGGFGGLILAMMSRVALGHTGRPLEAPRPMTFAYLAMAGAAGVRITGAIFAGGWSAALLWLAAGLWTGAWATFVWIYAPYLWRARADGRPG